MVGPILWYCHHQLCIVYGNTGGGGAFLAQARVLQKLRDDFAMLRRDGGGEDK